MKNVILGLTAVSCLAACGGNGGTTASGLLGADGSFLEPLEDARGGTANFAGTNNGYAYQVGMNASRSGFVTQAVLLDGTNLPAPSNGGTATMTAAYELETFEAPETDDVGLIGTRRSVAGDMALTVNFDSGTISGSDNGLAVSGNFNRTGTLEGTAQFEDMAGELAGDVGNTQAVGIFNGQSVTGIFAGGFVAE
ncbi:hypothetical protein SAMN04488515_2022 [Cognatiyoonia koreensis]|uniref:Transferrin-binding protein B C-lobe/N-lobe beta barrel domain-containing protein n=1 Tax=Cognatiyoonia koreensis TaxID=364200 RepID=A0A1I0QN51_9RHOB|nr:hypothetical protein [Cognatiyoonia koreensis]SEW28468.1 hypothetical protein SAMN04488515_2022 [Cognatiyoonia koreensis]